MKKSDFYFEEDYVIGGECEACGHREDNEFDECPKCGSDEIMNDTSHECIECAICGKMIEMWEDAYRNHEECDKLICEDCYEELED